jgi:ribose transport system permease protein
MVEAGSAHGGGIRKLGSKVIRDFGILIIFFVLCVVMSLLSDTFLTGVNLVNIARQASALIITAVGMSFVVLSAGIDLSVGSIIGLCGTLAAGFIGFSHFSTPVAVILALLIGLGVGLTNGVIIAKVNIPPFITTLAMLSIARGVSLLYTGGGPIYNLPPDFIALGRENILGIPISVVVMFAIIALGWFTLSKTTFGRSVYAVGGNEEATRLSGLSTSRIKILIYGISGLTAGVSGVLLSARLASGQPTLGQGNELDAIAAVVLGGTSLFGGRGQLWGTIVGGLILSVLGNGLNLIGVSSFWQLVVKGVVLLAAVMAYERGKVVRA